MVGLVLGERPRIAKREASMDDRLIDGRGGTMPFPLLRAIEGSEFGRKAAAQRVVSEGCERMKVEG